MNDTVDRDAALREEQRPVQERPRADRPAEPAQSPEDRALRDDRSHEADGGGDRSGRKSRLPLVALVVAIVIALIAGVTYWLRTRGLESTDDAYTEGNAISIAPKVSGYVMQLNVSDNTFVKAGQLLLTIDSADQKTALDQAQANLSLAQYQLAAARVDLTTTRVRAPATLDQARAQQAQAQANLDQAQRDYNRQRAVNPRATTQTTIDQAAALLKSQTAAVTSANAQVRVASLVAETIQAAEYTVNQREAQVAQAKAALEQAKTNLSYTELRAPHDGWVTERNVYRGTFVQTGQQVFYLVTPQLWIVANFKETQLTDMKPGQKVTISVDAFPALKLQGHVDSIQAGSGARFSVFPPENATGNFVKIVRRVPVKIEIDSGLDSNRSLPLGLSVVPTVTVG